MELFLDPTNTIIPHPENIQLKRCMSQDSQFSISMYFDPKTFMNYHEIQAEVEMHKVQVSPVSILKNIEQFEQVAESLPGPSRKSVFHNLNKHITTLIKKSCRFDAASFRQSESGSVALALWHLFLKGTSSSKRIFNIIFGFPSSIRQYSDLNLLAGEFKDFRKIKDRYGMDCIMKAQGMLREKVSEQLKVLSKETLQLTCRMKNFNIFYQYFGWFVKAVKEGSVDKRISKEEAGLLLRNSL